MIPYQGGGATLIENCIRCGRPTPYEINAPVEIRRWYVDKSGQLCEWCFSHLYPSSSVPSLTATQAEQGKTEDQEQQTNIKTIILNQPHTPTLPDQELYKAITAKEKLSDADREELARLYKKYTI